MNRVGLASLMSLVALLAGCPEETGPNPQPQPQPTGLEPPPSGQGVQIGTGEQPVPAGKEIQNCYFFKVSDLLKDAGLPTDKPFNLHKVEAFQNDGSHHMNIFRVKYPLTPEDEGGMDPEKGPYLSQDAPPEAKGGPCFKSSNWATWPLIANTQIDGTLDWEFPNGVANKLEPDEWIMLQSHFVNATTQTTPEGSGEVFVNFWHIPDNEVVHEMGTVFATKQSIRVCQGNPAPEFSGGCQIQSPEPVTVVGANGHFHSRGKSFEMYTWDGISTEEPAAGDKFYASTDWAEPEMARGDSIATIPANGGVRYTCDFQWSEPPAPLSCEDLNKFDGEKYMTPEDQQDCCYTFGPQVDRNEHCNIFVYYYPKSDDVSCN
jgi:hypothetical protein